MIFVLFCRCKEIKKYWMFSVLDDICGISKVWSCFLISWSTVFWYNVNPAISELSMACIANELTFPNDYPRMKVHARIWKAREVIMLFVLISWVECGFENLLGAIRGSLDEGCLKLRDGSHGLLHLCAPMVTSVVKKLIPC